MLRVAPLIAVVVWMTLLVRPARAVDLTEGVMTALPVRAGTAPTIDGDLADWDLAAAEPVYIAPQSAQQYHVEWALMYDAQALYIAAKVSLPGRALNNPHEPQDAFWSGDLVQVRLATDPNLVYPLDRDRDADSDRICHVSIWRNHNTNKSYLNITRGLKFNKGNQTNLPGTEVVITPQGATHYVVESRISWSALGSPDGKSPFKPGQRMSGVCEALWTGGDSTRVAACYRINPGVFAFSQPKTWGQIEFASKTLDTRRRPTMEAVLRDARQAADSDSSVGVPIVVDIPDDGLKLSVNIVGEKGQVLRELVGGLPQPKGKATVKWDGRDAWGRPLKPGTYSWAAYLSGGLKAEYRGAVGTAGDPPYPTLDGRGGWGGDHSLPLDVATDETGCYFLWPVSEAGKAIVKIDHNGATLWRANPFVGGGFGPFYSLAVDEQHVYLAIGNEQVRLVRLNRDTGKLLCWNDTTISELPIYHTKLKATAEADTAIDTHARDSGSAPPGSVFHANAAGMAIKGETLYLSSFSQDKIYMIATATGAVQGELPLAGPRGLTVGADGQLYAVSYSGPGQGRVCRLDNAAGSFAPVVEALEAPYDVAVDKAGSIYVTELGKSQQVKRFDPAGKLAATYGKPGGRPWQGKYSGEAFLKPAGLALDPRGNLLIMEAAVPKVISRLDMASGAITKRWFGPAVYWNHTWPMPDDPEQVFYTLNDGFGLAKPALEVDGRAPLYYWRPERSGYDFVDTLERSIPAPETIRAANGKTYLVRDTNPHLVLLLEDGLLRPVAVFDYKPPHLKAVNTLGKPYMDVWIDRNGDGQQQANEQSRVLRLKDGSPLPLLATHVGSMHMTESGDLYLVTQQNSVLQLKGAGFAGDGTINWNPDDLTVAVPTVLPGYPNLSTGWRSGILGMRRDKSGHLYVVFNATVAGSSSGPCDYASEQLAAQMQQGMGHSASCNVVKFAKFDPQGQLQWMAGRKATAGARPGEMYHFWNMSGLANDAYVAGGSEWGQIYLYTHDGFFVDALMNNPADSAPPGPYTFGGETCGGRIAYFPKQDQLWAYCMGGAYLVQGFKNGKVIGEHRIAGTVSLDRTYDRVGPAEPTTAEPLRIARVKANPLDDSDTWAGVPVTRIRQRGTADELASIQLAVDDRNLYARLQVVDSTPQANSADTLQTAFKGGDTAGIVLGPVRDQKSPGAGDIRLMAATIAGKPVLIAMKSETKLEKKPADYTTPASGTVHFDYVGEVPGGQLQLSSTAAGYTATFAVPLAFLEFKLTPETKLRGDVEIRLSGAGARGLQAVSRQYLFTPARSETTMVDDLPVESRLYPEHWGPIELVDRK